MKASGAILEHFSSAVQLGLTATPRAMRTSTPTTTSANPSTCTRSRRHQRRLLTLFQVKQISSNLDEYTFQPDDQVIAGEIDPDHTYTGKTSTPAFRSVRERSHESESSWTR